MDSFAIVLDWCFTVAAGVLMGLGIAQAASGTFVFRLFIIRRPDWSKAEIRVAGVAWAACGLVAAISGLMVGLEAIPGAGTPWILFSNPSVYAFFLALVTQLLVEQHHRAGWPFSRQQPTENRSRT